MELNTIHAMSFVNSVVRFTDSGSCLPLIPALKRWAILIRPLRGLNHFDLSYANKALKEAALDIAWQFVGS